MTISSLEELNLLHERICQAVSDPNRIMILYALHEQSRHVTALAKALSMSQPTASRHLGILRRRGLVKTERDGSTIIYRLTDERIIVALEVMREVLHDVLEYETALLK